MRSIFFLIVVFLTVQFPVSAEKRIALVIGNSHYDTAGWDLANPINDANAISEALKNVGFEVHLITDATADGMRDAFQQHGVRLKSAGTDAIGFVFFAGHGIQSAGLNYLIPKDASIYTEADVWRDAPRLGDLFLHLRSAGNKTNFIVLDACRNNGLLRSVRGANVGLASEGEVRGTLIAYSTRPGAVAEDGSGANSPYSEALVSLIERPGLSAESLFRNVATQVELTTDDRQQPWFESGLRGEKDFCFAGCQTLSGTSESESTDLSRALTSGSLSALSSFLRSYPESNSRSVVEREISRIESRPIVRTDSTESKITEYLAEDWRTLDPENLIVLETTHGDVAIELNADFAPRHVEQFRTLVRSKLYNGTRFYRVIDSFVAQAGLQDDDIISGYPALENENDRPLSNASFVPLGNVDLFAPIVGHIDGFAAARSQSLGKEWLLHCPGALAMARDTDPNSGSTEFYIVLDAQRYLDRNLTVFGRVIDGMEHIQKLKRGRREVQSGVIQAPQVGDQILSIKIAADMSPHIRPKYQVQAMPSQAFEDAKTAKRVRDDPFFYRKPPEILDICGFETPVRKTPE